MDVNGILFLFGRASAVRLSLPPLNWEARKPTIDRHHFCKMVNANISIKSLPLKISANCDQVHTLVAIVSIKRHSSKECTNAHNYPYVCLNSRNTLLRWNQIWNLLTLLFKKKNEFLSNEWIILLQLNLLLLGIYKIQSLDYF